MDYLTSQGFRSDRSLPVKQENPDHQNFIRFLQIAISLNVGFLPLIWDPALEALGSGATGVVKQSQLNAETGIAFKRFEVDVVQSSVGGEEFQNRQYDALITELNILGHREIRRHPNIISLVGVCFEIISHSNVVVPVLALAKAHHADLVVSLYEMPRLLGLERNTFPLLAVCGEIAKGLEILHQSGQFFITYLATMTRANLGRHRTLRYKTGQCVSCQGSVSARCHSDQSCRLFFRSLRGFRR